MRVLNSNIVTAFSEKTIGAKVIDQEIFYRLLNDAIIHHDFSKDRTPGQAVLNLYEDECFGYELGVIQLVKMCVSGGIGEKTDNPNDYVLREYRGQIQKFLKREFAAPVSFLKVVIYTKEAYLKDPDVVNDPLEHQRISSSSATHILVAVLAGAIESFVSPYRFVANLAGGNLDYGKMTKEELVDLAKKVKEFSDTWAVVAD